MLLGIDVSIGRDLIGKFGGVIIIDGVTTFLRQIASALRQEKKINKEFIEDFCANFNNGK